MKKAAIYLSAKIGGLLCKNSFKLQEDILKRECKNRNLKLMSKHIYIDFDFGDTMVNKPALAYLIAAAKRKEFEVVLFLGFFSYSINNDDGIGVYEKLKDYGVEIIFISLSLEHARIIKYSNEPKQLTGSQVNALRQIASKFMDVEDRPIYEDLIVITTN